MSENTVHIKAHADENTIWAEYTVAGPWAECFYLEDSKDEFWKWHSGGEHRFYCKYEEYVGDVPPSIAVIPFLSNLLPIAWLCEAAVYVDEIDSDFLQSLESVKLAFGSLYPSVSFSAQICAERIVLNRIGAPQGAPLILFSGGVDAVFTALSFRPVKPTLVTIRGADIFFSEASGWDRVREENASFAMNFGMTHTSLSSNFRFFLNYGVLDAKMELIEGCKCYWTNIQHGIALLGLCAPLAWVRKTSTIVISSSFSSKDDKPTKNGSDPTIDKALRFFDCQCQHYEFTTSRQEKVAYICEQSHLLDRNIRLRVCWKSFNGGNCSLCHKCLLTIFGLIAEGREPCDFGFSFLEGDLIAAFTEIKTESELWRQMQGRLLAQPDPSPLVRALSESLQIPRLASGKPPGRNAEDALPGGTAKTGALC